MKTTRENRFNVPNALSAYRLLALPFILYALYAHDRQLFILLLTVNLISDILDGLIARLFKLQTEFGAKLDSVGDIGTYLMAFLGMITLENTFVLAYKVEFVILIALWFIPQLCSIIKFRRFPSFHLWSYKATGYVQGVFIFSYFTMGFHEVYFYFMVVISCIAYLEELTLVLMLSKLQSNLKSIFLLQTRKLI